MSQRTRVCTATQRTPSVRTVVSRKARCESRAPRSTQRVVHEEHVDASEILTRSGKTAIDLVQHDAREGNAGSFKEVNANTRGKGKEATDDSGKEKHGHVPHRADPTTPRTSRRG